MTAKKPVRRPAKKKAGPTTEQTPNPSGYGAMEFGLIEKRLKSSPKRRAYVPPEQIAQLLRQYPEIPLSPTIRDYLCDFLEGKIKAPAGRPSDLGNPVKLLKKALIPLTYERYLTWLQKRNRTVGLDGWKQIRNADWWKGAPNERAARMTSHRFEYSMDWRGIQNIVSKAKK